MSQPVRSAADDADLAGRTLGDFRLLRRLGRGAMAEVYLAEQQSLRRQVALKVLKTALARDVSYVQRFQNEARAAAALVHANIVQIYEVGCADGVHYIAQEYVQGMNLREWMQRNGPPDVRLTVAVMRQTAAALHKAAQAGIVHRDIKPENIMLSKSGEVKVADFGLARIAREDDVLHLTQVGITMGTPLYMSPEQVEGKPIDSRSDLYSFGVTCYHLLAGSPPFAGETALAVAVQHLNTPPRRLEELRRDVPPGLARIVHRLIEKKPAERYASARELLTDLRALPIAAEEDAEVWAAGIDEQTAQALGQTVGIHAARSKLDDVMKTSAVVLRQRRDVWPRRVLLVCATAFLLGMAAAGVKARRTPSVLPAAGDRAAATIAKQDSARAQFLAAQIQLTDIEAWLRSVERYFPNDAYYVDRARQELARLYWREGRLDEALVLFDRFAERLETQYQAFGLAGRSLVQTKQGNLNAAAQTLAQLMPLRPQLDPRMNQELQYAIAANQKALRDKGLLPAESPASTVPRQNSAQEQLYLAQVQLSDKEKEDSLLSVGLHFPQDAYYVTAAKQELIKLYLQQDRRRDALPLCIELAGRESTDRAARAAGFAGQAMIAAEEQDAQRVGRALEQLLPAVEHLDPTLAEMLADTLTKTRPRLPPKIEPFWDAWREKIASGTGPTAAPGPNATPAAVGTPPVPPKASPPASPQASPSASSRASPPEK